MIFEETLHIAQTQIPQVEPTVKYKKCGIQLEKKFEQTSIMVIAKDPINTTIMLKELHANPVLLVINVDKEHDVSLRSNYCLTAKEKFNPLKGNELLYSPSVVAFRDEDYKMMNNPQGISIITTTINKELELLSANTLVFKEDIELWEKKIKHIFNVAYRHHHDAVVITTTDNNPPEHIARIYKRIVGEYGGCFKIVVFAVKPVYPESEKYEIFKQFLE